MYELALFIRQESLDNGRPDGEEDCAVALELNRYFGTKTQSIVNWEYAMIWIENEGRYSFIRLFHHEDVQDLIDDFDNKKPITPQTVHFSFSPA